MSLTLKNKRWHLAARLAVSLELLIVTALPASAGFLSPPKPPNIPSPSQSAGEMEQRYHIDTGAVQDQGENMNVGGGKKVTPEVSMFFSPSDPKEGERVTARAFPTYFSTDVSKLYFTWYLQRANCTLGSPPTPSCDLDVNGRVDENDWKIAAHRILAGNGFDYAAASYVVDTDSDGYDARFGGDNRVNVPNHCYYHDNVDGTNYEIVDTASDTQWNECDAAGLEPVCMVASADITPGTVSGSADGGSASSGSAGGGAVGVSGSSFEWTPGDDYVSGLPYCDGSGNAQCATGTPCCVANPATARSCDMLLTNCSVSSAGASNPICDHLFPIVPAPLGGYVVGDGNYGKDEEKFWQTDPNDPDTADNGNKDEANVVGLGRDNFEWNYLPGDKLGVAVEGTSMIPTKHKDSSNMIMWAFSKNNCPVGLAGGRGSYAKQINGYQVNFPTIEMDLNDCLPKNLVDPTEGGQATNLEMTVTASPDDVVNDVTTRGDGDLLEVTATINNASQGTQGIFFEWRVELSSDGTANPPTWEPITGALNNFPAPDARKLLSRVKGNGVNKVTLNMNMRSGDQFGGLPFSSYLASDIGYLRFRVDAYENFGAAGATRRGRSSSIVKFNASQDKIIAHTVNIAGTPAKLSIDAANEICSGIANPGDPPEYQVIQRLDGKLCRVIKNEIIGLELPGNDLSNFSWSINGQPLVCNSRVSVLNCADDKQGPINFFPIIGNVGDTFTISVTANKLDSTVSTEKAVSISRSFKIVEPSVTVISNDQNNVWAKVLGQYVDTQGAGYTDFSKNTLETYEGNPVTLRALFTPDFLGNQAPPKIERSWTVDGVRVGDGSSNTIAFPAAKIGQSVYNIALSAVYRPGTVTRQALTDIWGVSALDTTEIYFNSTIQVEQPDTSNITQSGAKKYFALLANYLPASVLFSIKVLFSVFLILFSSGVVFALIPNVPQSARRRF
ncbi:MAG: hypothetical protein ACEQSB_02525 [Undibacterium sp.]